MADVTLTSLEVVDGVLHIHGSNFTQTTTTVSVDGVDTEFTYVDATELTVDPAPDKGAEVSVTKNGVETDPVTVSDDTNPDPGMAATTLPGEGPAVEPTAIVPGTWPSPIDGFRAAVAGVPVTIVNPSPGDKLLPYPTGTPIAPGSKFWLTNGYYKSATPT